MFLDQIVDDVISYRVLLPTTRRLFHGRIFNVCEKNIAKFPGHQKCNLPSQIRVSDVN